jgi:hypothetical protein
MSTATNNKHDRPRRAEGLVLGLLLGAGFLALSLVRILGDANSALFGGRVLEATLEQSLWGSALVTRLAAFAGALLAAHLALGFVAWILARLSLAAWPRSSNGVRAWTCFWAVILMLWVLTANAHWFPSSSLGNPYAGLAQLAIGGVELFLLISLLVWGAIALTACRFLLSTPRFDRRTTAAVGATACLVAGFALISETVPRASAVQGVDRDKPNVIVIGFDSLRTDFIGGASGATLTPAIDEFLSRATLFSDAITPLARTFPAWVSILSGRHPHTTGAVINLFPRDLIREGDTLPELLRSVGYKTFYGIDEVRFSNLDESYGFDRMISPPIGSTDFLIGFFADTPLSNLLVNTALGKVLFSQLHGNRAAAVTYDPDAFIAQLDEGLELDSPSFIAVHFTLPHWPYTWASGPPLLRGYGSIDKLIASYPAAVTRVDQQFQDLMKLLDGKGALENAIVILLSDHGESLGDTLPFTQGEDTDPKAYGHGTEVLARHQYQVLLSMRTYGEPPLRLTDRRVVASPVSLEDVTPTVVDLLGIETAEAFDGVSLVPLLTGSQSGIDSNRVRFLETEFNPPGFNVNELTGASDLASAAKSYRIDPETDRVLIRADQVGDILARRQYAALRDGSLLASLPVEGGLAQSLVFAGADAEIIWLDSAPDPAGDSVAADLWRALSQRFEPVRNRSVLAPASVNTND